MGGRGAASGAGGRAVSLTWGEAQAMKRQMGQTGEEGRGFVNTSRSWNINAFLRGDPNFNRASGWIMSEQEIRQTVSNMDAKMKPLPKSIKTVRFVNENFLSSLGIDDGVIWRGTEGRIREVMRKGGTFTTPAFTSVSTNVRQNVFTDRPIKLNITVRRGAKAIITNNDAESEIVLGRNQKWKITGVRQNFDRMNVEMDITISR